MTDVLLTKRTQTSGTRQGFYFFTALLLTAFIFLLFSCASTRRAPYTYSEESKTSFIPEHFDWKPIYDGADYFCYENKAFPVRYHCVRIDLTTPGLTLHVFPDSDSDYRQKDGERTRFFKGKRTGKFAGETGADIAINTSLFAGKSGKWDTIAHVTSTRQIVGIHIVRGTRFSEPNERYAALLLNNADGRWYASILDTQAAPELATAEYALCGFWTILRDGEKVGSFLHIHDSRTACGISKDGNTLYLLIVEGEFLSMSDGLSYPECADVFLAMGADDAMQFDGGGSSSLFIGGKNMLSYPNARINAVSIGFSFNANMQDEPVIVQDESVIVQSEPK